MNWVRRAGRALVAGAALSLWLFIAPVVHAGGPLGPQGSRIQTSGYTVDLFQGPVLATTRIIGIAGAYTAIAEGADGIPYNPASVSVRMPYSTTRDDWDLTGGLTFPGSITNTDFDNNGTTKYATNNFIWASVGGLVQHNALGIGATLSAQNYGIGAPDPAGTAVLPGSNEVINELVIRLFRLDAVASYGFFDEQLHVGGGVRLASFFCIGNTQPVTTNPTTGERTFGSEQERVLLNTNAIGVQGGIVWTPYDLPLRLGAAARSPLVGGISDDSRIKPNAAGDRVVGNVFLPENVTLPWEVEAGIAVQLWDRPLNIRWHDEDKVPLDEAERWRRTKKNGQIEPAWRGARRMLMARYREIPRQKVLLSASTVLTGIVPNAVGFESMLSQTVDRAGEELSVSVRGGVESEVIPWWLVLRGGSYYEPTRFRESSARMHATGGLSVRVVKWSVFGLFDENTIWKASGAVDFARDYFGWSATIGTFY